MNVAGLTVTKEAREGFYPTPPSVAEKMLAGIKWLYIDTVLEPEAGKGDLMYQIAKSYHVNRGYHDRKLDVDYCEIDPALREVCKYNFAGKVAEIEKDLEPLRRLSSGELTYEQRSRLRAFEYESSVRKCISPHLVHDDFLSYKSFKRYDLIVMNPPFNEGAAHLLKALDMQKYGGSICCLLNAETIRNPFSEERRHLLRELDRLDADITFLDGAFSSAERRADVDVAIIKITIPEAKFESDIYERMKKAVEPEYIPDPEIQALVPGNYIDQAIQMYQVEVAATMELVRQYQALVPYMYVTLDENDKFHGHEPILRINFGSGCGLDSSWRPTDFNIQDYMRIVRLKYWRALFSNEKFIGRLTSELQEKFKRQVDKMADYEFSAFNIKQVLVDMNASMTQGVEDAILGLFDELTEEHSWYPECTQNRHYYNGWATNKAHKIGKKSIVPVNMFYYRGSGEAFNTDKAYEVISDLEKAFDYLDGKKEDDFDLRHRLKVAAETGETKNIRCRYFFVDFFKKGTMHIKFYPGTMRLVERLNIYASRKKGWLPPNYGRVKYEDMREREQAVVDSFHGDGGAGSGAKAYGEVLAASDFYLGDPSQKIPALMAPAG